MRPLRLQHDDRSGNRAIVRKGKVHMTDAQGARPLGRCAIQPQLRSCTVPSNHFDLLKRHALTQPGSKGFEARFLRGESCRQRLRAVCATGTGRPLCLGEDLFFEPALSQRSRDPLDRDDVHPESQDHA